MRSSVTAESHCGVNHIQSVFTQPGSFATQVIKDRNARMSARPGKRDLRWLRNYCLPKRQNGCPQRFDCLASHQNQTGYVDRSLCIPVRPTSRPCPRNDASILSLLRRLSSKSILPRDQLPLAWRVLRVHRSRLYAYLFWGRLS
jgi:hypothetical protein